MTDLTGIWESEIVDYTNPHKHTGELKITHTGTFVLSNSTTWDMWSGYVEVIDDAEQLTASFLNEGLRYIIRAQVRSNGTALMGSWQSIEPQARTGAYLAKRKVVRNEGPTNDS